METGSKPVVTVESTVRAPIDKVWDCWTKPEHITKWCQASDDWHAPFAENDLRTGGMFRTTMAAKDGSMSFDFEGVYTRVAKEESIDYTIIGGRRVEITFLKTGDGIKVTESFEAESVNSPEMQKSGWQAILDNFKKYTEQNFGS